MPTKKTYDRPAERTNRSAAGNVSSKGVSRQAVRLSATQPVQLRHELHVGDGAFKTPAGITLENTLNPILSKKSLNYGFRIGNDDSPKTASKETESAMFRPNSAYAYIDKVQGGEKRAKLIDQYGYVGSQERAIFGRKRVQTYDGGHLIGHQFFGNEADIHGNLAPQHNKFNQLSWRLFEEIVQEGFRVPGRHYSGKFGEEVTAKVTLRYASDNYQRSIKDLFEAGVIDEEQYKCILGDGHKDDELLTFDNFVPVDWEGHAQATTEPTAKSTQITRALKGGYAYNIQEDKDAIQDVVPHDVEEDDYFPASQESHSAFGISNIEDQLLSYGGNNIETFSGKQAVPRPVNKQKPANIADYYYLNKSSGGETKSEIVKIIVPGLTQKVSMTQLRKLDGKLGPGKLGEQSGQFDHLMFKIGHGRVCQFLVKRLNSYPVPSGKTAIKAFLELVAAKSEIKDKTAKIKFLSLWMDPNFVE
ncbi:MAG TPA: DNA/RNA non-specific endonuclease [Dinghuibacter sp.]|jgi:hypothetical protein|uniref:DNA/RNA non-specific endonuclease n=1 Tax=Dinghuibacter sp. TaxID=2024697 RepID=UPI002BB6AF71|nr:DNA/RNA non-specific endonuclease [Dinghuibacter sp.]HTJ11688.1 DNA/RNA non-specific endonuclease [Dinghuibacter sp.]